VLQFTVMLPEGSIVTPAKSQVLLPLLRVAFAAEADCVNPNAAQASPTASKLTRVIRGTAFIDASSLDGVGALALFVL
jgi:hypothetical protein